MIMNNKTSSLLSYKKLIILSVVHITATIIFLFIFAGIYNVAPWSDYIEKYDEISFYLGIMAGLIRDVTFLIIPFSTLMEWWISKKNDCLWFNIIVAVTALVSFIIEKDEL